MSYQVLARKWRPKNFQELLGQDSARQTLTNALSKNRLYPVLIFTGPRGTGKTSTARIVAKSLRCQNKKSDSSACEKCEDCLSISNSSHLDVIEIDGASNNGVEAVRELRDKVSYMPGTGDWKVYIIDEVHMLSNSAFNALLKTLEEPPQHVVFIMATTESQKIPATVLSRCQKIDFHLLPPLVIKKQLENICKKEAFPISEDLLWILARQAQGSLRDAQSLLDQVITFCGTDAKEEDVRRLLGLSDPKILEDTLKALIQRQEKEILSLIAKLRYKSSTPKYFLQNLLSSFSHLLFLKKNPTNDPPLLPLSEEEIQRKKELASLISYEQLHFLFDMLLKGEREMNLSHDSELVLEVLLLRMCSAPQLELIAPFSPQNQSSRQAIQNSSSPPSSKITNPLNKNQKLKSDSSSTQDSSKNSFLKTPSSLPPQYVTPENSITAKKPAVPKPSLPPQYITPENSITTATPAAPKTSLPPQYVTPKNSITAKKPAVPKPSLPSQYVTPENSITTATPKTSNHFRSKASQNEKVLNPSESLLSKNSLEAVSSKKNSPDLKKSSELSTAHSATAHSAENDSFEGRFEFLNQLKKKDPLLGSLIDHLSFRRISSLEFKVFIPKQFSYLEKKLEQSDIKKKLERELSLFLNLEQKTKLIYQVTENLEQSLKQEKDQKEKEELLKQAEENAFIQDLKHAFNVRIRSIKKIDKKREDN